MLVLFGIFLGIISLLIPRLRFLASYAFFIPLFSAVAGFLDFWGVAFVQERLFAHASRLSGLRALLNLVLVCSFPLSMLVAAAGGFVLARRINRFFAPNNNKSIENG